MDGDIGLGGSEAGGLGDAGYGPSGPSDFGGSGGGGYTSPGEMDQAAANFNSSLAGYGINEGIPGLGASETGPMHSPGLSYATLNVLNDIGLGKMDIPGFSQNVEQALAAQNVHNVLNYAAPALASMVPGYGTLSTLGRLVSGLHQGTMSPTQALGTLGAGLIGAKTGIPSGILEGLFEGNLGKAAGAGASAGLGALASSFGPVGSLAYGLSGLGPAVGRSVAESVSGATGGLGSFPGAGPAPSTSTAPTGNVYGDASVTQDISPVLAAIEQEAQQAQPAFRREMLAGRYGPIVQYEFGA